MINLRSEFERSTNTVSARVTIKGSLGKGNGRGEAVGLMAVSWESVERCRVGGLGILDLSSSSSWILLSICGWGDNRACGIGGTDTCPVVLERAAETQRKHVARATLTLSPFDNCEATAFRGKVSGIGHSGCSGFELLYLDTGWMAI